MPWSTDRYPPAMLHLDPRVRRKAIEIANAILERAPRDEGRAIRIGIAQAKAWAAREGLPASVGHGPSTFEGE